MHFKSLAAVFVLALLVSFGELRPVVAARRGGGGNGAAQKRQRMIAAAQMQLAQAQQVLAAAEVAVNDAQSQISASTERIEGARKTISEARTGTNESRKSQKSIEAEILSAQSEGSEYARSSVAFHEAQDELKSAKEQVLSSDAYMTEKAALLKEDGHAAKVAKWERDALADNPTYQGALDKAKATKLVYDRVRSELFKANADWVAATTASKDASVEESKANAEATKGAMKKMPALRNLREAQAVADNARASIAEAMMVLRAYNAVPKGMPTTGPYGSTSASVGK